jgi:hypothetical protein
MPSTSAPREGKTRCAATSKSAPSRTGVVCGVRQIDGYPVELSRLQRVMQPREDSVPSDIDDLGAGGQLGRSGHRDQIAVIAGPFSNAEPGCGTAAWRCRRHAASEVRHTPTMTQLR